MIPPIQCKRALQILRDMRHDTLSINADEIEQLIKFGLVVESDPDHLKAALKFEALREEFAEHFEDPMSPDGYKSALVDVEEKLKNEWYRLRTSKERIREHEESRVHLRQALGMLSDPAELASLKKLNEDASIIQPGAKYIQCPALGVEVYAITRLGTRVYFDLKLRIARVAEAPLSAFIKSFNKAEAKMEAFSSDIAHLTKGVGYVKKNPEQVVIGLAKSGMQPAQALDNYHTALASTRAPAMAVTFTRNAVQAGSAANASKRLHQGAAALHAVGFPNDQAVMGAAKSLLAFDPPSAGVPRFVDLFNRLQTTFGRGEHVYKYIVRLMPASGTPREVVQRTIEAGRILRDAQQRASLGPVAVALSAMVKDQAALPAIIKRFFDIEVELVKHRIASAENANVHALECLACPGTPEEVAGTVRALCLKINPGWPPVPQTVAIATAFAKRFAY